MPRKTLKRSRKHQRRTLRRIPKKGGADSQSLIPPNSAFGSKIGAPENSDSLVHKIA
jgi:hypothetical protein